FGFRKMLMKLLPVFHSFQGRAVLRQLAVILHEASRFAHATYFSYNTKILDRTAGPSSSAIRLFILATWVRSPLARCLERQGGVGRSLSRSTRVAQFPLTRAASFLFASKANMSASSPTNPLASASCKASRTRR